MNGKTFISVFFLSLSCFSLGFLVGDLGDEVESVSIWYNATGKNSMGVDGRVVLVEVDGKTFVIDANENQNHPVIQKMD